jgi:hypothetical protein
MYEAITLAAPVPQYQWCISFGHRCVTPVVVVVANACRGAASAGHAVRRLDLALWNRRQPRAKVLTPVAEEPVSGLGAATLAPVRSA